MSAAVQVELPAYVPLRRKVQREDGTIVKEVVAHAIVDAADYEAVTTACRWRLNRHGYVQGMPRGPVRKTTSLHRFLMRPPPGMVVDHVNGDPLDNRRCNLRVCTIQENNRNKTASFGGSSRYRGVQRKREAPNRWSAQIQHEGRLYALGKWETEHEAALAYDEASRALFAEFASPNLPGVKAPEHVAAYVARRVSGACVTCGSAEHHGGECPGRITTERRECCGRPVYDPHRHDCPNAKNGREVGDSGRCSLCGEPGHYKPRCPRNPDRKARNQGRYCCGLCGGRGHNARACEHVTSRNDCEIPEGGSLRG